MIILQQARGLLSSNDQLALDLPLAETKSITARVGPTPVFTRASTATFIGSNGLIQSAAVNEPRFEHNPLTGVCGGLLLEQSRTNICLQSENFGTTSSNDVGLVAISINQTTSPSGAMDADKISENTTVSNRRIAIQNLSFVSGTTYTFSCFVKAAERDFVQLRFGSAFGGQFQNFIVGGVNAGTIGSGVGATAAIQAYPNGWYRCSITATSGTTGSNSVTIGPQVSSTALAWQPYVGTIGSGIFVWGAQVEAGATATSYIPTTAGTAVRSQDLYTITGAAFTDMYNQTEGSIFCAVTSVGATTATSAVYGIQAPVRSNGGVSAEFISTLFRSLVYSTGFTTQAVLQTTASRNVLVKNAVAFRTDDFANSCNGNIATDTSGTLPAIMDRFVIGATGNNGGPQIGNNIFSSIKYYRKRLPDAKLQALTI
jgi:hypothetical protein